MDATAEEIKEAYRLFYLIKGHLDSPEATVMSSYNSYFRRAWQSGSDGAPHYERDEMFEEAWAKKIEEDTIEKVANLGYD
tara:strand:- start:373 stop:612 length:240 start_codon:yes stop_codon:yes gene_type:complete